MDPNRLKTARLAAGWTQTQAAVLLGVSQPYYSQMESGARPIPAVAARKAFRKFHLTPVALPLPALALHLSPMDEDALAYALGGLGYPGFAYFARLHPGAAMICNPAELVARALVHTELDVRIVEGLPWLLANVAGLDWSWLIGQCRLVNVQNRLGFLVYLAGELPAPPQAEALAKALAELETSRLAWEGTLCRDSMREPERSWVRQYRPSHAAHWNLLTTLEVHQLTHAA